MNVETLPVTCQALIPESYRDDMGHMNVMWYTHLYDQATVRLFELIGMDRRYFDTNHTGAFALKQHSHRSIYGDDGMVRKEAQIVWKYWAFGWQRADAHKRRIANPAVENGNECESVDCAVSELLKTAISWASDFRWASSSALRAASSEAKPAGVKVPL